MSVDRLVELRRKRGLTGQHQVELTTPLGPVAEEPSRYGIEDELLVMSSSSAGDTLPNIDTQLTEDEIDLQIQLYKPINSLIVEINRGTAELNRLRIKDQKTSDDKGQRQIANEMQQTTSKIMALSTDVKDALYQIKELNDQYDLDDANQNSTRGQIRHNLYGNTVRKFQQAVANFSEARDAFKVSVQDRMARSIVFVDPSKSREEALELVEAGQAEKIILQGLASDNLRDVCLDLRARQGELVMLAGNVEALLVMFRELHYIIQLNGESINVIDQHIARAGDYVHSAEEHIKVTTVQDKRGRAVLCGLLMLLLCIAILVLAPILITSLGPPGGRSGGEE